MSISLGMKDARARLRAKQCLSCGQPQTNVELNSCSNKDCIRELRPVYRWTKKVIAHLNLPQSTTYIGSYGGGFSVNSNFSR
jgi:hypothetical protein